jgi:hypothetical protein
VYFSPVISKENEMSRANRMHQEMRNSYTSFVGKYEGKKLLED